VFLQIIGRNQRFYFISVIYYISVETIYCYFRIVLKSVLKLYKHLIKDPGDTGDVLTTHDLLRSTQNVSIREQVIVFLQIIGWNKRFYFISVIYYMSVETIYCYFRIVLKSGLKLYKHLIKDPGDTGDVVTSRDLLRSTQNVSIREQVIVFLQIIGWNQRFYFISVIYYMSIETIYCYFRIVLKSVLKLYKHLIKDPGDTVFAEIMNNCRFYPYFKVWEQYQYFYTLINYIYKKNL
jgi:DNA-directed RNA polymerase subunit RPC12/RpoP